MIKVSTKSVKIEADLTKEQETALLGGSGRSGSGAPSR